MFLRRATAALAIAALTISSPALILASQTSAASATGTWTGTIIFMRDGKVVDDDPVYMVLKHEGSAVTGTAGPSAERQFPVAKGKSTTTKDGTTLAFEVTAGNLVINFELKLASGSMKGSAVGVKDGETQTATVELQPVK